MRATKMNYSILCRVNSLIPVKIVKHSITNILNPSADVQLANKQRPVLRFPIDYSKYR
jgi:hypothetical protein